MKTTFCICLFVLLTSFGATGIATAQTQEPRDGSNKIFHDEFLNNLQGDWKLTRKIRGQTLQNSVHAEWVLNHQFLFIHMKDVNRPARYEAMIYMGYDNEGQRYVAHWIDIFGGKISETLGYGKRDGNSIQFIFEYPDMSFHNTFTWNAETRCWTSLMQHKDKEGKWSTFAEDELRRN